MRCCQILQVPANDMPCYKMKSSLSVRRRLFCFYKIFGYHLKCLLLLHKQPRVLLISAGFTAWRVRSSIDRVGSSGTNLFRLHNPCASTLRRSPRNERGVWSPWPFHSMVSAEGGLFLVVALWVPVLGAGVRTLTFPRLLNL